MKKLTEIYVAKNKTEQMMFGVMDRLKQSKKDYLVITKDSRGVLYVGASSKKEFLETVKLHIEQMIKECDK